ncbi:AAA family ATPase [Amycolatopsis sp. CA-126428]|uniref:AAA family ATPase n=1 Tax=Amycolatopsis sp. CA-126428 TaxID=2073158 RepID=UPI0013048845|nr:AAA family ATPase [Amycolatopsis sp. CA-126428]
MILPDGTTRLEGNSPVVVIGPNGSGKTRQTRNLRTATDITIDFVNALRNTRVAPELPVMGFDTARSNFQGQKNQARNAHWELTSEFDFMLSQLIAQSSMMAMQFVSRFRENSAEVGQPEAGPLERVEDLWKKVYPGRKLLWRDWKPLVVSTVNGDSVEYSANQMSDGEKAALYLAGRVFLADPGVLVVDEPETHFHSLLAVRLWNALEDARPDVRFVYVTHDLTFALSRRDARYVLASPTDGLRAIEIDGDLPGDVAGALLGSASLSFYASRVVFCEGEESSLDRQLYSAWFNGIDTVVKPVGSCQMVLRCVESLRRSGIAQSLSATGIIDGDFHSDAFKGGVPAGVHALRLHEVESLYCLVGVVRAICEHLSADFDEPSYLQQLGASVSEAQRHQLVVQRWKARIEPNLAGIVSGVSKKGHSLDNLVKELPNIFDPSNWSFSPQDLLQEEKKRVESVIPGGAEEQLLSLIPGKQLVPLAARTAGMQLSAYTDLVAKALVNAEDVALKPLHDKLVSALTPYLPERFS